MWATWANLGPRQGQNCAQIGPTSDHNNNNHHHNPRRRRQRQQQKKLRRPRQQQQPQQRPQQQQQQEQQQQQQPRAKTGANLRPNRANIGRQQQQEQRRQRQQQEQQQRRRRRRGRRRRRLQQRLPALMLASLACANSMCKMALPTSVYATCTRAVSPLRMKDAAGTPEVPAPVLHRGEVKTTPKASVTPHQQQPPTQQPQPRHTTLPRLRPRTWTWITPNAYLPRVCFGRRPAVRRKPHKSGQGPPGRGIAARRFSPLRRREGPPPQPQTTSYRQKLSRFTVFCALRIFRSFRRFRSLWLKMGQHGPT